MLFFISLIGGFKRASQIKQKLARGQSISSKSLSLRKESHFYLISFTFHWESNLTLKMESKRNKERRQKEIFSLSFQNVQLALSHLIHLSTLSPTLGWVLWQNIENSKILYTQELYLVVNTSVHTDII